MSELCRSCLIKQIGKPQGKIILSKESDLCESCGEVKPVVVKIKKGIFDFLLKK